MNFFDELNANLATLRSRGAKIFSAGNSVLGEDIPALIMGDKSPVVLMHASIHSREHVTTAALMHHLLNFTPKHSRLLVVPVANPDGVKIATEGTAHLDEDERAFFDGLDVAPNQIKCNARGVDLNVNFDARWGTGKLNQRRAGAANYIGPYFHSEPETQSLVALTKRYRPTLSISWHAKGQVIYWTFGRRASYEAEFSEMAGKYAVSSGYPLLRADGSAGGYKDWFIAEGYGMGLTIEVGRDDLSHDRLYDDLDNIIDETKEVLHLADEHAATIYRRRIYAPGH